VPGRATYREVLPRPELAASVACFWTLSAEPGAGEASRVLPDGSMDLLFDLTGLDAPSVVGAMTEALISGGRERRPSKRLGAPRDRARMERSAHLTRDLRRLAGITPSELARALRATTSDPPTAMSDSFNPSPGPLPILAP